VGWVLVGVCDWGRDRERVSVPFGWNGTGGGGYVGTWMGRLGMDEFDGAIERVG